MAILQDTVGVKITSYNINYYQAKGYEAKNGDVVTIDVNDLSHGSGVKVLVECDFCQKPFMKPYRDYIRTQNNVCCKDCRKYKFAKTNMERYGFACSLRNPEIHKKAKQTLMEKYGVEYPLLSKEIQDKCTKTFQERYNANSYRLTSQDISKIMKKQSGQHGICSQEQLDLCAIIGGELNIRMGKYIIDIVFLEEHIACEYNGGGHILGVIHGRLTLEELREKDFNKYRFLIDNNFKCFVIENPKPGLPPNDKLLKIKERGFAVLKEQNDICVYIYNIVNNTESLLKSSDL